MKGEQGGSDLLCKMRWPVRGKANIRKTRTVYFIELCSTILKKTRGIFASIFVVRPLDFVLNLFKDLDLLSAFAGVVGYQEFS